MTAPARPKRRPRGRTGKPMALVTIAEFADPIGAGILRDRLATAGIEALVFDGAAASLGLGWIMPARLMVEAEDEAAARTILAGD